jgi:uncharacterized membrane-anchored protein YhcB (DUF1043 family)
MTNFMHECRAMEEEMNKVKEESENRNKEVKDKFSEAEEEKTKMLEMIENMKKCCDATTQFVNSNIGRL